jgi:hypothetical protein
MQEYTEYQVYTRQSFPQACCARSGEDVDIKLKTIRVHIAEVMKEQLRVAVTASRRKDSPTAH